MHEERDSGFALVSLNLIADLRCMIDARDLAGSEHVLRSVEECRPVSILNRQQTFKVVADAFAAGLRKGTATQHSPTAPTLAHNHHPKKG